MEGSEKIVVYLEFDTPITASICKTKLDAYGIPCFLTEENLANLYPGNHILSCKVRLHLFERDLERARQITEEQNLTTTDTFLTCPGCQSQRLERDFPKRLYDKAFSALGVLFFGIFIPQKKIYRCLDCEQEFD